MDGTNMAVLLVWLTVDQFDRFHEVCQVRGEPAVQVRTFGQCMCRFAKEERRVNHIFPVRWVRRQFVQDLGDDLAGECR